jgi:hypothetical protein
MVVPFLPAEPITQMIIIKKTKINTKKRILNNIATSMAKIVKQLVASIRFLIMSKFY